MGRSNGQKAQQKRERNMKKQAGANKANSTLKTRDQALTIKCELCLTPFMGNSSKLVLQQHVEMKHPKATFEQGFPTFDK